MEDNAVSIYWIWTAGVVLAFYIIGKARVRKLRGSLDDRHYGDMYASDNLHYQGTEIPFGYFIPLILMCIFEIGAVCLYPHETCHLIDEATPSYSTNNWFWTSFAACFAGFPIGIQIYLLFDLFYKTEPESEILKYTISGFNIVGIGCCVWAFISVYSIWIVWVPILYGDLFSNLLWPLTPIEKEAYNNSKDNLVYTTPSSSSTPYTPSRSSSSSSNSSSSRSSYPSSSSSHDDSSEQRKEMYRRQAEEYLYQARQYEDEASRLESEADSYIRSAEDNEYWARESNDSFKLSEARSDRSRASSLRYQANQARSKASRYYSLYDDALYKSR